jgi:hypothetical protein
MTTELLISALDKLPDPYGFVTTHAITGQEFFFRYPESPYLDTAKSCISVYSYQVMSDIAAERDAAIKDAMRYRIWRAAFTALDFGGSGLVTNLAEAYTPEQVDAVIDAWVNDATRGQTAPHNLGET